jgi:hypothetical protein
MDDLWQAADLCRMTNVMRPYLELLGSPDQEDAGRAAVPRRSRNWSANSTRK